MSDFKLNPSATKKDLIEEYKSLLGEYQSTVKKRQAEQKKMTELEKRLETVAADTAGEATVSSVVASIGKLKTRFSGVNYCLLFQSRNLNNITGSPHRLF